MKSMRDSPESWSLNSQCSSEGVEQSRGEEREFCCLHFLTAAWKARASVERQWSLIESRDYSLRLSCVWDMIMCLFLCRQQILSQNAVRDGKALMWPLTSAFLCNAIFFWGPLVRSTITRVRRSGTFRQGENNGMPCSQCGAAGGP